MWGIPLRQLSRKRPSRITPTCVGNTKNLLGYKATAEDHPHMCGEYTVVCGISWYCPGSPPHVWGILTFQFTYIAFDRITPTCVGNTNSDNTGTNSVTGSPPHVWGIRLCRGRTYDHPGITPTCVGNTLKKHRQTGIPKFQNRHFL